MYHANLTINEYKKYVEQFTIVANASDIKWYVFAGHFKIQI